MNIGCRIIKDFTRPPKELVRQFYDLATSDLDDTMSRFGAVDHSITPLKKYTRSVVGTAFTIRLPHGDNLLFRAAIQYTKRGDVVVIDAGGFADRAVAGEVTAKYCKARGVKGLIIDGQPVTRRPLLKWTIFSSLPKASALTDHSLTDRGKSTCRLLSGDRLCILVISLLPIRTGLSLFVRTRPNRSWNSQRRLRPGTRQPTPTRRNGILQPGLGL